MFSSLLVSPNRGTARNGLQSTLPAPIDPKHHLILGRANMCERKIWQMERKIMGVRGKLCRTAKKYEEENNVGQRKQLILNSQNGVKNLCPLRCTNRTGKCDQLVTCLVDRRKSRISEKVVQNKTKQNNGIEEPPWMATRRILISIDTYQRLRPAPTKSTVVLT